MQQDKGALVSNCSCSSLSWTSELLNSVPGLKGVWTVKTGAVGIPAMGLSGVTESLSGKIQGRGNPSSRGLVMIMILFRKPLFS